jgi:phospholipid N-methyltransferase
VGDFIIEVHYSIRLVPFRCKTMIDKIDSWNNTDNNDFYEALKIEGMQKFAEKGGLASSCDVRLLTPYWSKAHSILEVGAGYGRVIDYLLKHQFKGTITAIERCNTLFQYLSDHYQSFGNVNLLHADIRHQSYKGERFDLIFMLWSVIAEFGSHEQSLLIGKLAKLLKKNGRLVIDAISKNVIPLKAVQNGKQSYSVKVNSAVVHTYVPNSSEIRQYAKAIGFSDINHVNYRTDVGRERWLYILS